MKTDKEIRETLRRVRSAAVVILQETEGLNLDPSPEKPRKRENLRQERMDRYEVMYATGKRTRGMSSPKRKRTG